MAMLRNIPPSLTALGRRSLPDTINVLGQCYYKSHVFKNDFFAVTALYKNNSSKVILKVHRQAPFLLFPMGWVGRWLASREQAAFEKLDGVEGIPRWISKWGKTGIVREYVEGHPLSKGERVSDDFHPRLRSIIEQIHAHEMAYVDLEKCENVLVGDDGKPYLFDFQIAWYWPGKWGGNLRPITTLRKWFQKGDFYHLVKLQRRTRPDQLTEELIAASYRKPWYVRWHRLLTYPFTWCRRKILDRIDPKRSSGERGRIST